MIAHSNGKELWIVRKNYLDLYELQIGGHAESIKLIHQIHLEHDCTMIYSFSLKKYAHLCIPCSTNFLNGSYCLESSIGRARLFRLIDSAMCDFGELHLPSSSLKEVSLIFGTCIYLFCACFDGFVHIYKLEDTEAASIKKLLLYPISSIDFNEVYFCKNFQADEGINNVLVSCSRGLFVFYERDQKVFYAELLNTAPFSVPNYSLTSSIYVNSIVLSIKTPPMCFYVPMTQCFAHF